MSKVWEEYKNIKCGDFIKWWDNLNTKQKSEWKNKKEEINSQCKLILFTE